MLNGARVLAFGLFVLASACSNAREYPLKGQVLFVDPAKQEITVKHEDVRGFMPGMTMPFKVPDKTGFGSVAPGDLITATLVVEETAGYLQDVAKTGSAPLPPEAKLLPRATILEPGDAVPDVSFTDQTGASRRLSDWRGKVVALTFIYTRCPIPNFCPLMDRHFAAVQRQVKAEALLDSRVHLVSISFDPEHDTPEVLAKHAARVGADPGQWSFVTAPWEVIDPFARVFGVAIMRDDKPTQEILHNLRTAIIGKDGRLVRVLNGNEWTPEELMTAIREADAQS
jgi:protein SCO1/2